MQGATALGINAKKEDPIGAVGGEGEGNLLLDQPSGKGWGTQEAQRSPVRSAQSGA
ncbi:protein of unknown function [Cyanobium sp. NIES-981]|nr:protein of unknown function [Cyanobium sp. NIES-981]